MHIFLLLLMSGCSWENGHFTGGRSLDGGDDVSDTGFSEDAILNEGSSGGSGQLTAGEWSDLDNWDFWRDLLEDETQIWGALESGWGFDTARRIPVQVISEGEPVVDAAVELIDEQSQVIWHARTNNEGHAELFADAADEGRFGIQVAQEIVWIGAVDARAEQRISVETSSASEPDSVIDLMFVIDTTGSMSDELEYLKVELADVISRVRSETGLDIRISVNFYRDDGDEYVVRSFPFSTNVAQTMHQLDAQSASGGGDIPEALDSALEDAIFAHSWSESARARLLFTLLDAPPHQSQAILGSLEQSVEAAATQGIRILPIAASGADKSTEILLRAMDVLTGGTYIFLTDDSGIGNDHLEPTVGPFQIELLNELLIRVIEEAVE